MRTHLVTALVVALAAVGVLAAGASASSGSAKVRVVPIAMHDPGCHWFLVGGKYQKALTVAGATSFRNVDEAPLIVNGTKFHRLIPVGKSLTIAKAGTYHITMVKQAPDDNHLLLVVK
jgi:hypothetical protein